MFYYYNFLVIAAVIFLIILSVMLAMKRSVLKTRLQDLRERIGNDSKHFPLLLHSLRDEIFIAESELASRQM